MAQINFKLAAQMAQITLHNRSSRHRWHRSSLQTQARGTDGIHRLARHKLHATHGTDHLARHKLHDTDGTDRLGRHNLTAQMPQIIPSITAQMHPSRRKLHGTDRSLFQTQARGTDRTDHPQTHASRDRSPCQTEASRHRWIRSFSKSQVPRCIWHGSSFYEILTFRSVKCAPSHCQTYPRQRRRRSSQATRGRWHRSSCQTQASRHRWHRSPC